MIIVSSIVGKRGVPFMGAYCGDQVRAGRPRRMPARRTRRHRHSRHGRLSDFHGNRFFEVMTRESGFATRAHGSAAERRTRRRRHRAGDRASGARSLSVPHWRSGWPFSTPSRPASATASSSAGAASQPDYESIEIVDFDERSTSIDDHRSTFYADPRSRSRARRGRTRAHRRRLGARPAARPRVEGHRHRGVRRRRRPGCARSSNRSAASKPSARASRSTSSATSTSRCRGANRRPAAATRASTSPAIRR